jgi:hypothetical protein
MRPRALLPICLLAAGACYEYAPVPAASAPAAGTPLRVQLSAPVDVPVRDVTVRGVVELTGESIALRGDSMRLSVFALRSETGYAAAAQGETVTFPRAAVVQLERRRLSPWKTGLAAALLAATGFAAKESGLVSGSGGTPGSGGQKQ